MSSKLGTKHIRAGLIILMGGLAPASVVAETVYVKYRGPLDLSNLQCEWVTRSSLVQRLCYDKGNQYVVVSLQGTYYHYCAVPPSVVSQWRAADSMGKYFNAAIKGRYDGRVNPVPAY
jgi:hypothetical protein